MRAERPQDAKLIFFCSPPPLILLYQLANVRLWAAENINERQLATRRWLDRVFIDKKMPKLECKCLLYREYGKPDEVVKYESVEVDTDVLATRFGEARDGETWGEARVFAFADQIAFSFVGFVLRLCQVGRIRGLAFEMARPKYQKNRRKLQAT